MSEETILNINCEDLTADVLNSYIYPNSDINLYWTDDWSSSFYSDLAKAGFISTALIHPDLGPVLLPEIQFDYAVLDWKRLHISRKIQKKINNRFYEENGFYIQVTTDITAVCKGIEKTHHENWLIPEYQYVLSEVIKIDNGVNPFAVELWNGKSNSLVAGEIGYTIGGVYTSLSGFCNRDKTFPNSGTLQLIMLAKILENAGFSFWNLGHPHMKYKTSLGAEILSRERFLQRWSRSVKLESLHEKVIDKQFNCDIL